jgi:hypothetical protein
VRRAFTSHVQAAALVMHTRDDRSRGATCRRVCATRRRQDERGEGDAQSGTDVHCRASYSLPRRAYDTRPPRWWDDVPRWPVAHGTSS